MLVDNFLLTRLLDLIEFISRIKYMGKLLFRQLNREVQTGKNGAVLAGVKFVKVTSLLLVSQVVLGA